MELKHIKAFISEDEKAIDETKHRILFTIPETVDRDDEIVTAEAIFKAINDQKSFAANPICLPCHQHRLEGGEPPCVGSWDVESAKQLKNSVNMYLNFAHTTKLGGAYWDCYSQKHMRAISIGFNANEWRMEDRAGKQIRIIYKIELFEISCVAVGCNPGALSKLKSDFGWMEQKDVPQNAKAYFDEKFKELKDTVMEQFELLKTSIIPDRDGLAKALLSQDALDSPAPADKAESLMKTIEKILYERLTNG